MTSIMTHEPTWAVACIGAYGMSATSGSRLAGQPGGEPVAPAARPRQTAVRHMAWPQRMQGRSVFTAALISRQAQAQATRLNVAAVNDRYVVTADNKAVLVDDDVWGPCPWRPPSV